MRKIALCNQKGGVAKTTTAINLAAYLAVLGKKTLVVDMDPQSNATSGLGINKNEIQNSIYNVLHEHIGIEQAIISTDIDGLSIVPSNINLTGAEVELVNVMGREYRLKKALESIENDYDFAIIDCPPSLGLLTINGLGAANSILIPIQCEYYALEGLGQLMNTFNLIKENVNENIEIEGVLMTMADFRTNLTKEVISEVKKHFGDKVYKAVIPRTIKLTEAPGFGKPIVLYDKESIGARKYEELAKEILGIKDTEASEKGNNQEVQVSDNKELINNQEESHGEEVRERT